VGISQTHWSVGFQLDKLSLKSSLSVELNRFHWIDSNNTVKTGVWIQFGFDNRSSTPMFICYPFRLVVVLLGQSRLVLTLVEKTQIWEVVGCHFPQMAFENDSHELECLFCIFDPQKLHQNVLNSCNKWLRDFGIESLVSCTKTQTSGWPEF